MREVFRKGKDVYFVFLDLEKRMIELIEMQCGMFCDYMELVVDCCEE